MKIFKREAFDGIKLILILFTFSCNNQSNTSTQEQFNEKKLKEKLVRANKVYYKNEDEAIDDYVQRHAYTMQKTSTGVRYMIYKNGKGKKAEHDKVVEINYSVQTIDGTLCYNSDSTGNLNFKIGQSDLPSGLQQALQLMHQGDKAILITPSNLGYGLTGDGDKIPPNAVLVYDVELLKVN
jgi:FKBP-type peptidyl-prolyl cis-trans isomerase